LEKIKCIWSKHK